MPTHVFQTASGIGYQVGETGGVSGGGGGTLPGTLTIEEIMDKDDGGSNQLGVLFNQTGFENAPANCSATSRAELLWKTSASNRASLYAGDESSSTGDNNFLLDQAQTYRPIADRPPANVNFEDQDGDLGSEQYFRNLSTYTYGAKEVNYVDGEGFNDTARGDIYWNGVKVYDAGFNMGSTWSPGNTVVGSDGATYQIGSYQEVYNSDEYYAVYRYFPREEVYRYTTTNTITKLKMDFVADTITTASGTVVPLRTMGVQTLGAGTTSTGWITSNLTTGISWKVQQLTGNVSDDTKTHLTDGTIKLYAGDASNEALLKEFRVRVYTHATSTY